MTAVQSRRAVVLVVDGWGAGYLGPYGNTWLDTPVCNELAAASCVYEQAWCDSIDLVQLYQALATGQSGLRNKAGDQLPADFLTSAGRRVVRLTDERLLEPTGAWRFVDTGGDSTRAISVVDDPAETGLARFFRQAEEAFDQPDWDLLWLHTRGLHGSWDAPLEFRWQFMDDEDPEPPDAALPPTGPIPADADPDFLQGWRWAYAGQVSLLDSCLRPLWDRWSDAREPLLWVVLGARGFPLGEHGHWGHSGTRLYGNQLHVPLMVGCTGSGDEPFHSAGLRCLDVVQPHELTHLLAAWWGGAAPAETAWGAGSRSTNPCRGPLPPQPPGPTWTVARHQSAWAVRTPAWLITALAQAPEAERGREGAASRRTWSIELYAKPDDRWEVNDVACRCPRVVQAAELFLDELVSMAGEAAGPVGAWPQLPPILRDPLT